MKEILLGFHTSTPYLTYLNRVHYLRITASEKRNGIHLISNFLRVSIVAWYILTFNYYKPQVFPLFGQDPFRLFCLR